MTNVILRGLSDFEGETLAVFLAGLDCGDFPVINGRIFVPLGSAGGLLTARYLTQVSAMGRDWGVNTIVLDGGVWTVPCVVGYRYKSRGQLLRPAASDQTGTPDGPAFGKTRRVHQYAALLESAGPTLSFGTDFDRLYPINASAPGEVALTPTELFSGIIVDTIEDESSFDGMLAWEVTGPYSAKVCALGGFIKVE